MKPSGSEAAGAGLALPAPAGATGSMVKLRKRPRGAAWDAPARAPATST